MILLTGATGRIGGAAARELANAGVRFRVFVRDAAKFPLTDHPNIEVLVGDLEDSAAVQSALSGISRSLLVTANGESQEALEINFARSAEKAGVQHIVKISSMEAGPDAKATFPKMHYTIENAIKDLDLNWTMVRPNFFMQNLLLFAAGIKNAGVFALPLGKAKTGLLDAADVGAFCASLLQTDGHEGKTYEVTGSELIDFYDVASRMSVVLEKEVKYIDQDPAEFKEFLSQFIKSQWHLDGVCGLFAEIANHSLEKSTTTLADTLGRPPVTLEEFTKAFKPAFV